MEMKNVIISIIGTQANPYGENDTIELVTDGKYLFENGEGHLSYMESELTGLDGTKTSFMTDKSSIVMQREGSLNSRMVFEEGKKHLFLYDTPFGATIMGVNTSRIKNLLSETGGDMEVDYVIDFEHSVVGHNSFKINVREQRKDGETNCQTL